MNNSKVAWLLIGCVVATLKPWSAQAEGWKLHGKELHPWVIIKEPGISSG